MKALVLSGGGSKGAFQVGVLKRLLRNKPDLDYDIYTGISVGALNASLLATEPLKDSLPKLEKIWLEDIKGNSSIWKHLLIKILMIFIILSLVFCSTSFMFYIFSMPMWSVLLAGFLSFLSAGMTVGFFMWGRLPANKSIYDTKPLRKLVENGLDIEKLKTSGKKLRIGAVSYQTGKYKSVNEQNNNIIDWIMASSAFPVFFPMPYIDGENWMDGGVIDTVPLKDAIDIGATDIDIILTAPLGLKDTNDDKILNQISRTIEIMTKEIMKNDIVYDSNLDIKIRIIVPKVIFKFDSLKFKPKDITDMFFTDYEVIFNNK